MPNSDCLFCKIAKKEIATEILKEEENIIVFKDINPQAPVHILIVPKKHIEWKDDFKKEDLELLSELILVAKKIAQKENIEKAFKLVFNVGQTAHFPHIHLHLLGGWRGKIPQ